MDVNCYQLLIAIAAISIYQLFVEAKPTLTRIIVYMYISCAVFQLHTYLLGICILDVYHNVHAFRYLRHFI